MAHANIPPVTTLWLDETEISRIGSTRTAAFCTEYQLGNDIQERLRDNGLDQITSLFNLNEEDLKKRDLGIASIGEIRWALRRMFWEKHPEVRVVTPRETEINIRGRQGARGTHGPTQGGTGGTGRAATIDWAQFKGVHTIRGESCCGCNKHSLNFALGGTGGVGGTTGIPPTGSTAGQGDAGEAVGTGGTVDETETRRRYNPTPAARRDMIPEEEMEKMAVVQEDIVSEGGGEGPSISTIYLGLFRTIIARNDEVLHELSTFNASIPEKTLRNIPMTPLEDLQLDLVLLKMLRDDGFETVGGLLESHPGDLASAAGFESGYPKIIREALGEFCGRFRVEN
ncbi:hypothetical protein R3P38DRAFT_2850274 [Favolaschia claudopus]|uniref:SAM domain-containing protein n=1 Tax=Favolaschia claudopus TaxID=2862362 RepID=A0AAW0DWR0_9AGAR